MNQRNNLVRLEFRNVQKKIIQVKMKMLEEEDSACVDKILEFNFVGNREAMQCFQRYGSNQLC